MLTPGTGQSCFIKGPFVPKNGADDARNPSRKCDARDTNAQPPIDVRVEDLAKAAATK